MKEMKILLNCGLKKCCILLFIVFFNTPNLFAQMFEYHTFGANGNITLAAYLNCSGNVVYTMVSNRRLRDVTIRYDGGAITNLVDEGIWNNTVNSPHTSSEFPDGYTYQWDKDFTSYNYNASVHISFEYHNGVSFCGACNASVVLDYSHFGTLGSYSLDFDVNELSTPNLVEFVYTGTDILASGTGISSYDYTLDYDLNDEVNGASSTITGTSLTTNSIIGNSSVNPHFYCNTGHSPIVDVKLEVIGYYPIRLSSGSSTYMTCSKDLTKAVNIDDLCTYLTGFDVESIPTDEFYMQANASEVTPEGAGLEGFITDQTINFNGPSPSGTNQTVSSLGGSLTHTYPSGVYTDYYVEEEVTFSGGCSCLNHVYYNTGDPCNNMGAMTLSHQYSAEYGDYLYTLTPSSYAGGAPSVPGVHHYVIDWGDGSSNTYYPGDPMTHVYDDDGYYYIVQRTYFGDGSGEPCPIRIGDSGASTGTGSVFVDTYCCENFAPEEGDRYWLSAWVKEDLLTQVKSYTNTSIEIEFEGASPTVFQFYPTGDIIEGWQRIVGEFKVPDNSTELKVHLINTENSINAYFDDVRIHPFNASMKSYVYDPETLWLTAELDDNNYATFYEYDKEGQLIRIKKETARGIMTIQESRSSNPKKPE